MITWRVLLSDEMTKPDHKSLLFTCTTDDSQVSIPSLFLTSTDTSSLVTETQFKAEFIAESNSTVDIGIGWPWLVYRDSPIAIDITPAQMMSDPSDLTTSLLSDRCATSSLKWGQMLPWCEYSTSEALLLSKWVDVMKFESNYDSNGKHES